MIDRIKAWLKSKEELEKDPLATDGDYVNEQMAILLQQADDILNRLLQN